MQQGRADVGTIDDLHASARKITGLDDFGTDDYGEALAVLLESYARDARLTPWGNKAIRATLRGALVARQPAVDQLSVGIHDDSRPCLGAPGPLDLDAGSDGGHDPDPCCSSTAGFEHLVRHVLPRTRRTPTVSLRFVVL